MRRPLVLGFGPLGLARITVGGAAICATLGMAPALLDLFSNEGVAPLGPLLTDMVREDRVSVFDLARADWVLVGLYASTLVSLMSFTVGYRTRWSSVLSFILYTGLVERNLPATGGASEVFQVMLFWLMWTEAGACFSVDSQLAARKGAPLPRSGPAWPIRLCQLQVGWIYLSTGLFKLSGTSWRDGTAVHFFLGIDHDIALPLGRWLFAHPRLTGLATWGTLAFELSFLPLVFWPFRRSRPGVLGRLPAWLSQPNATAVALVTGFVLHLGMLLTCNLPYFSLAMLGCYPLFFDPAWLPCKTSDDSVRPVVWSRWRLARDVVLTALLLVAALNRGPPQLPAVVPHAIERVVLALELWQSWHMVAPDPLKVDSFLEASGVLSDGTVVDVLRGDEGGPVPPPRQNYYWTEYLKSLAYQYDPWKLQFGRFLCRRWNRPDRPSRALLTEFKIYREERDVPPVGVPIGSWRRMEFWDHQCVR